MSKRRQTGRTYCFGQFQLDREDRRLLCGGNAVPLTPKAFDTLLILVENAGRLVEKGELMQTVWPDTFVEEAGLTRNISVLRKVLGRDSSGRDYIETVPKLGYRFVATVTLPEIRTTEVWEKHTISQTITVQDDEIIETPPAPSIDVDKAGLQHRLGLNRISRRWTIATLLAVVLSASLLARFFLHRTSASESSAPIRSIAVLPFKNIDSSPPEDEHEGLGFADILITRLSTIKELSVRPTSAILGFVNQNLESDIIGTQINVDAVLEGSIYHSSDKVRVTARLIKVSSGTPVWAGQFEKPSNDELRLQDEIALQVVDALLLNLSLNERKALTRRYTENASAYELYLKGRYQWNKRSAEGMAEAERLFRNAIEKDPNFALAYVGLADRLATSKAPEANLAVEKAIELDPNLAEAHATLGFIQMFHEWKWSEAENSLRRSIELNPGYETSHHWYATLLEIEGRNNEAIAEFQRALAINPRSHNLLADLGQAFYFAHEYDSAKDYCRKALEFYPDFHFAHWYLSDIYLQTGEYDAAVDELLRADELNFSSTAAPENQKTRAEEYNAKFMGIYRARGIRGFFDARLSPKNADPNSAYNCARGYAFLGEKERALDNLEVAYTGKAFVSAFVKIDPVFDGLRSEPRYAAILRNMGLQY